MCDECGEAFTLAAHLARHAPACLGSKPTLDRLAAVGLATRTDTGCLVWNAKRNTSNYGVVADKAAKVCGERRVHRISWIATNGPIPSGLLVLHSCDNPPCFEVSHLFLGTQQDNMADMAQKGRDGGRFQSFPVPTQECLICGSVFQHSRNKTCSLSCAAKLSWKTAPARNMGTARPAARTREIRGCQVCGSSYSVRPSSTKATCSGACGNTFRTSQAQAAFARKPKPEYVCEVCGAVFVPEKPRNHHRTCSRECGYKLRTRTRSEQTRTTT